MRLPGWLRLLLSAFVGALLGAGAMALLLPPCRQREPEARVVILERDSRAHRSRETQMKFLSVQTARGVAEATAALVLYEDGEVDRYPLIVTLTRTGTHPGPALSWHDNPDGKHVRFFGKRIPCDEGGVVYCDAEAATFRVLDGFGWSTEMFENEQKREALIRKVIDTLPAGTQPSVTAATTSEGDHSAGTMPSP